MADLRAEQIVAGVLALLKGSGAPRPTSAAEKIHRGPVDPLQQSVDFEPNGTSTVWYAVGVFQGADAPAGDRGRSNVSLMDSILEVRTEAAVRCSDAAVLETELNQLRKEIHKAMMAPTALSTLRAADIVIDIIPGGSNEPELNGDQDEKTGSMVIEWGIHYRHSVTDASE